MSRNTSISSRETSAALSRVAGVTLERSPCNIPAVKMQHSSEFMYINEGLCTVPEGTSGNVVDVLAQ